MSVFTENMEVFADFQKQGFEPVRQFTGAAVETFETLARKNYAFAGDMLEFAVSQARLPVEINEPKELIERQVAAGKEFTELLTSRTNEYVELGKAFQEKASNLVNAEAPKAARKTTRKAA
ncbi:MAG: phasin family protein [Lysobacterales bacterium]